MSFELYFLLSSYAFLSSGFLALALTNRLDPITLVLYVLGLGASFYVERERPGKRISLNVARLLALGAIPVFAVDAMFMTGPFLALARFVLWMSVVKLFQEKQDSDWVWIYAIAFFEVLLASSLTIDMTFILSLVLFLFFFVATLGAFEIRRSHRHVGRVEEEDHVTRGDGPRPVRRVRNLVAISGAQLGLVVLVAIPIFYIMPRFSGGAIGSALGQPQNLTGFSETVRLGDVGQIKESEIVVMRIALDKNPGRTIRWRGVTLDIYDGERWSDAVPRFTLLTPHPGTRQFVISRDAIRPESELNQTIILEGIDTDTLFAAQMPVTLEATLRAVRVDDSSRTLRGPIHPGARFSYRVRSDIERPSAEVLSRDESTDYPEFVRRFDLLVPDTLDPRVGELARAIVGDATTSFEKARRVERYLKDNYGYSLELRRSDRSLDPVADFLINTRVGHCEYFASSMVLLLRSVDVPCRLVNGFQMGEYNDIADTYVVRQADAHSWVEVYFAGPDRWVEFDPTPSAGLNQYGMTSLADYMRQTAEAAQMFWIQYVVGLDDVEQVSMIRAAQSRFSGMKSWLLGKRNAWRDWGYKQAASALRSGLVSRRGVIVGIAVLLGVGALAFAGFVLHGRGWVLGGFAFPFWRLRGMRRGRPDPQRTAVLFYEQMTALLAQRGLVRERHMTPREFADSTGMDEVRTVTEYYHRTRFGGVLDEETEREVGAALSGLAARLRRKK
jgi:protein-glutamine gamma-glutamyltransferase